MKKPSKVTAALLCGITLFTACGQSDEKIPDFDITEDYFVYEQLLRPTCFDVGEDGTIYAFCGSEPYEEVIGDKTYMVSDTYFYTCALDGNAVQRFKVDLKVNAVEYSDGKLYCLVMDKEKSRLVTMDIDSGETEDIAVFDEFSMFKSLDITRSTAYIVGISDERAGISGEYSDEFGVYEYNGEKLISVDLDNGKVTGSDVEYPVSGAAYGDKFMVYAADKDGYFFSDFNGGNKVYNDLGGVICFEMFENDSFVYRSDDLIGKLAAGSFDPEKGTAEIIENIIFGDNTIQYQGGCTFVMKSDGEAENRRIIRLKNSEYLKPSNKIKYISTEYNLESPFGCGYTIERLELDDESFSLTVLSQDRSYDICLINSKESVSGNIRDKGSFYPLNEVEGVNEYLDKCFPYIKDSAVTSDGEIWALPISVTAPVIMYNEELCSEAGTAFSGDMSLSQLIDNAYTAYNSEYSGGYELQRYQLTQNVFLQYLAHNNSFDTELFRDTVKLLYERANLSVPSETFPMFTDEINNMFSGNDSGFLFSYLYYLADQQLYADFCGDMRAVPTPNINGGGKNAATCVYLAVNPSSDNLAAALDYISSLCEYLGEKHNSFVLRDKAYYSDSAFVNDVYRIYENSEICFNISSEIFFDDYQNYCAGSVSLDEFISEADRKLTAYLNE